MAQTDRDLASIAEARALARRAKAAAPVLAELSQAQIDAIVDAMAAAATAEAESLARLAHEETGFGVARDKVLKNLEIQALISWKTFTKCAVFGIVNVR